MLLVLQKAVDRDGMSHSREGTGEGGVQVESLLSVGTAPAAQTRISECWSVPAGRRGHCLFNPLWCSARGRTGPSQTTVGQCARVCMYACAHARVCRGRCSERQDFCMAAGPPLPEKGSSQFPHFLQEPL